MHKHHKADNDWYTSNNPTDGKLPSFSHCSKEIPTQIIKKRCSCYIVCPKSRALYIRQSQEIAPQDNSSFHILLYPDHSSVFSLLSLFRTVCRSKKQQIFIFKKLELENVISKSSHKASVTTSKNAQYVFTDTDSVRLVCC